MRILTSSELKEADIHTVSQKGITTLGLMEEAAHQCTLWLVSRFSSEHNFKIFCGTGNNGGDGLAIARLLLEKGYNVEVFVVRFSQKVSEEFKINEEKLKSFIDIREIKEKHDIQKIKIIEKDSIVIDCLLGTGLNKPTRALLNDVINFLNSLTLKIISIDIPSGLHSDEPMNESTSIINATNTLALHSPKLSFMFRENARYVGELSIIDIGLDKEFTESLGSKNYFVTSEMVRKILKPRKKFSNKGDYGHALLIAGSRGKIGAVVLAAQACLRSGCGLLTVHSPVCAYDILQSVVPEAMVEPDESENHITGLKKIDKYNSIGVGPGLGIEKETQNVLKLLIQNATIPLILDADALNILSENKTWFAFLPGNSILTPHVKEFERLFGKCEDGYHRYLLQKENAIRYGIYILLKGAHSSIACPDGRVFFNSTGNSGMASGGTGDTLTGILTGLFAQGYNSIDSVVLGTYLHGLSADIFTVNQSEESLVASDIISNLGTAINYLRRKF